MDRSDAVWDARRSTRPLFVTGYSKSGTTLMLALLDGHPALCVFPKESEFFTVAKSELSVDPVRGVRRFVERSIVGVQFGVERALELPIDASEYERRLLENWSKRQFRLDRFLQEAVLLYGEMTTQRSPTWWVEKTPQTESHVDLLRRWYPSMACLYVIRDPRDNFAAMRRWHRMKGSTFRLERFLYEWKVSVRDARRAAEQVPTLVVRYEDLVDDPKGEMERVAEFLGIAWSEVLVVPTLGGAPWSGNSSSGFEFKGISQARVASWKRELRKTDVRRIEKLYGRAKQGAMFAKVDGLSMVGLDPRLVLYGCYRSLPSGIREFVLRLLRMVRTD